MIAVIGRLLFARKRTTCYAGGQKKSYTYAQKINLPMTECKQVRQPSTNQYKGRLSKWT